MRSALLNDMLGRQDLQIQIARVIKQVRGVLFFLLLKCITTKATWPCLQVDIHHSNVRRVKNSSSGKTKTRHNAKHCTKSGFTAQWKPHDHQGSPCDNRRSQRSSTTQSPQSLLSKERTETSILSITLGRHCPHSFQHDRRSAAFLFPPQERSTPTSEVFPR